jgi:hypothetical protein
MLTTSVPASRIWRINEGSGSSFACDNPSFAPISVTSGPSSWDQHGHRFNKTTIALVSASAITDLPTGNNPVWLSAAFRMVYVGSSPVQDQIVTYGAQESNGGKTVFGLFRNNTSLSWFIYTRGGTYLEGNFAVTLAANTWYHAIILYSGAQIKLYLNGSIVGTISAFAANFARDYIWIGEDKPPQTDTINGYVRNVRVGGNVLTAQDAEAIYNEDHL